MKKTMSFLFLFFLFLSTTASAQGNAIDSLMALYEQATEDAVKIDLLQQLVNINWDRDREKTIEYNQEILRLTENGNFKEKRLKALQSLGGQYNNLRQHRMAIDYLKKAMAYREKHQLTSVSLEKLYNILGIAHHLLFEHDIANDYLQKALSLAVAHKDTMIIAEIRRNLGDLFDESGKLEKALELYLLARSFYLTWDNPAQPFQLAITDFRIGSVYMKMAEQQEGEQREASFQKVAEYFSSGAEAGKDYPGIQWGASLHLSHLYEQTGDLALALEYAKKTKEAFTGIENDYKIIISNIKIASVLVKMGKNEAAIAHTDTAFIYVEGNPAYWEYNWRIKKIQFDAYTNIGDYKKALTIVPEMEVAKDSMNQQKLSAEVAKLETSYELDKKEKEIEAQQLLLEKQNQQRNFLIFLSMLLFALAIAIYYAYRQKTKYSKKLENLNQVIRLQTNELKIANNNLRDFSKTISHDILSQIELIISLTNHGGWQQSTTIKEDLLNRTRKTAKKLKRFALGLITLSKVEEESQPLKDININNIVQQVKENLQEQISETNAIITMSDLPTIPAHEPQMIQLFQNLLGNAIKYKTSTETPVIDISVKEQEEDYLFAVKDNGLGISKENQETVFQSFYQVTNEGNGAGLGLAICKRIVEYYGGKIWVESDLGKGVTVFFTYPL